MSIPTQLAKTCIVLLALVSSLALPQSISRVWADEPWSFMLPEQRRTQIRSPEQLCPAPTAMMPRPPTVTDRQLDKPIRYLSLSEAINTSLANSDVIRVLTGVTATSSGRTVYDVAITNTQIDQQRATFDPTLRVNQAWSNDETGLGLVDPLDPNAAIIGGSRNRGYALDLGLSKRNLVGGVIDFGTNSNNSRLLPGGRALNPQNNSSVDLSYTQPLLRGAGAAVNTIPIVLARIDTERSYFQLKGAVQRNVFGVIDAYWQLVFSRTNLWARQQQTRQLEFAFNRAIAAEEAGILSKGEAAQTRVAYQNFRANLIAAEADVLQREAALRNILGFAPYDADLVVPVTPLLGDKLDIDWDRIVSLAEVQRPDIIELKLILEADQQRLIVSKNRALPTLDGVALYRWDGLNGEMPNGNTINSTPGQFTDWNVGINFSVPLGLRQDRALLRAQELIIQRDRANLDQGLHAAVHTLGQNLRNLAQFYEQYLRFQDVREAATLNLDQQTESYLAGREQFIVALQAVVDWGNAVSSEAQALVQYNTELARLEVETGTILETHGVTFFEERFGSIGPLGRLAAPKPYPMATRPSHDTTRYPSGDKPSEKFFDLRDPLEGTQQRRQSTTEPLDFDSPRLSPELLESPSPAIPQARKPFQVRAAEAIKKLFR